MTDMNRVDSSNLDAIKSDGTVISANKVMTGGSLTALGCTLANGTTYYFPFGAQRSPVPAETPLVSVQLRWDASIIATITVETTLFPATFQGGDPRGPAQVSDFETTAGFWLQQNASTAYVPATGGTPTAMTVAVAGGSAGGCEFDLGNLGARRGRIKVVVGGTGGVMRCAVHGKAAA
jgi:hypothetical protein